MVSEWDRRDAEALPWLQNGYTVVGQWSPPNKCVVQQFSVPQSGLRFCLPCASSVPPLCHLCASVHYVGGLELTIFTWDQFWPSGIVVACIDLSAVCVCSSVRQPFGCSCDELWPIQAMITKFGPEVQNTLVKVPVVFGDDWPWPSRLNLPVTLKVKIYPILSLSSAP